MKPPAKAVVGQLVWSADGGVWAVWRVSPFAHAHASASEKLTVHGRLRGLLLGLPAESMLLSTCERLDTWDVVADMLDGVTHPDANRWSEVCAATADHLTDTSLHRRRYYAAALLPGAGGNGWRDLVRQATGDVAAGFGLAPAPVPAAEIDARRRQARAIETRIASQVVLERATAGELRWLWARALRRDLREPAFDDSWEPAARPAKRGTASVLAPLTDVVVKEGGYRDDPDRPRHRRYIRIDAGVGTAFQTVLAVADLPHEWVFPGGGGEWLHHADDLGFPVDWCVRIRSVPNAEAQAKVRRQHRQLVGQVDEYDGEITGAPPSLAEAIGAIDAQRAELAANPAEPEIQATILLSVAAPDLALLEDRAQAVIGLFEPHEYGLGRPTGSQLALLRSMLPGTAAAPACRDYTQFLLARDLASGAPFCGPEVGDPRGLLLGLGLDSGAPTPVLLDPTYGPSVGRTASLAAVGALGSGKSFFLKRLCWDTISRGGQVVTIDRTTRGEYATFAAAAPGTAQVIRLAPDSDVCLDPLQTFTGDDRVSVTLGFLSLLAGASAHTEEGAALAEAVRTVANRPTARLADVVDELNTLGDNTSRPDPAARSLARRLAHYRHLGAGQLAFGDAEPVRLDADLIVFWAPNLALPDRDTLLNEHLARQMLPEQVLAHALLYLVAAVGRQVVFSDPTRFGAALYDEAWALLGSPHGQRLLLEGIRDGRKHNGAIWLASQHPADLGDGELIDLVGARFAFRQAPGAATAAAGFLGIDPDDATTSLARLGTGQCLYRDVRDRVGLIQVLEPALPGLRDAFDTTPTTAAPAPTPTVARPEPPGPAPAAPPAPALVAVAPTVGPSRPSSADIAREAARQRRRTPLASVLATDQ